MNYQRRSFVVALALVWSSLAHAETTTQPCPLRGWSEGLNQYQTPTAAFPTSDTQNLPTPDCFFHQWSWEAFTWATALDADGVPRFMTLPTPEELLSTAPNTKEAHPRKLKLAARSLMLHGTPGYTEGAGAIVEADGNVLVGPNGYPVYASVHMNPTYFTTAQENLIVNGGYVKQPANAYFNVGDAIFKATWLRLDPGQPAPAGAFTTQAEVPVLTVLRTKSTIAIVPAKGEFTTVTVALVGLHVVGYTVNHPEFLWGTFEHNLNTPEVPDNTFTTAGSSANNYTFYQANTPYTQVNIANVPPTLTFNTATQRFAPVTNAVQQNQTGGENQTNGPANVAAINTQAQSFFAGEKPPQSVFANYHLVGTLWMKPNSYNLESDQSSGVGSVSLANTTAETFVQGTTNTPTPPQTVQNCFMCHNPTSYSFQTPPPAKLTNRLIAISHVLGIGTPYAVPNLITGNVGAPNPPVGEFEIRRKNAK